MPTPEQSRPERTNLALVLSERNREIQGKVDVQIEENCNSVFNEKIQKLNCQKDLCI